jgi:hypothetical protein
MTHLVRVALIIKLILHIRLIDFHIHYHNSLNYYFGYELTSYSPIDKNTLALEFCMSKSGKS